MNQEITKHILIFSPYNKFKMKHNDFIQTGIAFCDNLVAARISDATRQLKAIDTDVLNDRKLAKKIEKLNKMMNEANILSAEIYDKVCRY